MCYLCRQTPCHPRCPNAPEPRPVKVCKNCGNGVYEGDVYYDFEDGILCDDCLYEMSAKDYLEFIGENVSVA